MGAQPSIVAKCGTEGAEGDGEEACPCVRERSRVKTRFPSSSQGLARRGPSVGGRGLVEVHQ